jgi:hypothetical protein
MARTRSGESLIDDVYKKTDLAAFTDRFPRTEVLRHINQGGAELWDILVSVRGKTFARSASPWSITTAAETTDYTSGFPSDFLDLISARVDGPGGYMLKPMQSPEEAWQLEAGIANYGPDFYELLPSLLRLTPMHTAGLTVIIEYAKTFTDITDSSGSLFDGINGWEDYLVAHAAMELFIKEGEPAEAALMQAQKDRIAERVRKRAAMRDRGPQRVRDVRGERVGVWGGRWRG